MKRAIIDIGSHSILFIAAEYVDNSMNILKEEATTTLLAEKMNQSNRIDEEKFDYTVDVVEKYIKAADELNCPVKIVATAALRDARNSQKLIDLIQQKAEKDITILSGTEEARYAFLANKKIFKGKSNICLVDLGGASTELVVANSGGLNKTFSFPFGVIDIRARFNIKSKVVISDFYRVDKYVHEILHQHNMTKEEVNKIVFVGGTASTLAFIKRRLTEYDSTKIQNTLFTREQLWIELSRLNQKSSSALVKVKRMEKGREKHLHVGILLIIAIMRYFDANTMRVNGCGVEYGLLMEDLIDA